jgi:hypothetical protein
LQKLQLQLQAEQARLQQEFDLRDKRETAERELRKTEFQILKENSSSNVKMDPFKGDENTDTYLLHFE